MSIEDILKSTEVPALEYRLGRLLAELPAAIPEGKTIDVGGTTYTVDELRTKVATYLSLFTQPRETRSALHRQVVERDGACPEVVGFLTDVRSGVSGILGRTNPAMDKLGFPQRKQAKKPTLDELGERIEKARETREGDNPA
jgi:hypothetical protein